MSRTLSLIFCLCLSLRFFASDLLFKNINVSHGLYTNQTWLVESLDNRMLLVGAGIKFALYDGCMFHDLDYPVDKSIGITSYVPMNVQRDSMGNLWIQNEQRLFLFSQATNEFLPVADYLPSGTTRLFVDTADRLWLQLHDGTIGVKTMNSECETVTRLSHDVVLSGVVNDNQVCFLFTSDGQRLEWNNIQGKITKHGTYGSRENKEWTNIVSCVYGDGQIVAIDRYGEHGLYFLQNGEFRSIEVRDTAFLKLMSDGEGGFYLVCWMNIWHYNRNLQIDGHVDMLHTTHGSIKNEFFFDATVDWQGGLWIAHFSKGLFYAHNKGNKVRRVELPDGVDLELRNMVRGADGEIFFSTMNVLYRLDTHTLKAEKVTGMYTDEYYMLYYDTPTSTLWLATRSGVYMKSPTETKLFYTGNVKGMPRDRCIFAIPVSTDKVLCCSGSVDVGFVNTRDMTFTPIKKTTKMQRLYRDFYKACYDQLRGKVYFASTQGLFVLNLADGNLDEVFSQQSGFASYASLVSNMYTSPHCLFAAATSRGLVAVRTPKDTVLINRNAGLLGEFVHSVCYDDNHGLWLGSGVSVAKVNGMSGKATNGGLFSVHNIYLGEILDGGELIDGCMCACDGRLWCATTRCLYAIEPVSADVQQAFKSSFILSSIELEHGEIIYPQRGSDDVKLSYADNFFTLHLSTCNYMWPEYSRFRYMLRGYDRSWKEINNTTCGLDLAYTSVSPGTYELLVSYSLDGGGWSEPTSWRIKVIPPIYRTWWAYCLYLLFLVLLVILGFFIYKRYKILITQLKEKRNKYIIQAETVKHQETEIKSRDKILLEKAVALVNEHLNDTDYGVEELSEGMGMSRSTLYRNLQDIVGQTPSEFINTIRCRYAAQMLKESNTSIKEIAYHVGFNDIRYFRKAFKDLYGVTPQEYRNTP